MALEEHRAAVRGQGGATSWLRGEALRGPTTLTLRFELEALDPVALPRWLGSTLHGALGRALHGLDKDQLMQAVQPSAALPPHLAAMSSPPLLVVPPTPRRARTLAPGERLQFETVLLGRALHEARTVVRAVGRMASRGLGSGRGRLALVCAHDEHGLVAQGQEIVREPVPDAGRDDAGRDDASCDDASCDDAGCDVAGNARGGLEFWTVTPLRLVSRGELVRRPDFAAIVLAAARRLAALRVHHEGARVELRLDAVAAAAADVPVIDAHWRRFQEMRWSGRQRAKHPVEGIEGGARFGEGSAAWMPLLARAARVGIGKGGAFGFGRYGLRAPSETQARARLEGRTATEEEAWQ